MGTHSRFQKGLKLGKNAPDGYDISATRGELSQFDIAAFDLRSIPANAGTTSRSSPRRSSNRPRSVEPRVRGTPPQTRTKLPADLRHRQAAAQLGASRKMGFVGQPASTGRPSASATTPPSERRRSRACTVPQPSMASAPPRCASALPASKRCARASRRCSDSTSTVYRGTTALAAIAAAFTCNAAMITEPAIAASFTTASLCLSHQDGSRRA